MRSSCSSRAAACWIVCKEALLIVFVLFGWFCFYGLLVFLLNTYRYMHLEEAKELAFGYSILRNWCFTDGEKSPPKYFVEGLFCIEGWMK